MIYRSSFQYAAVVTLFVMNVLHYCGIRLWEFVFFETLRV